ncbi:MAG: hypothetical protein QW524_01470 [Candidatus Woesearchaeota archaeon]
MKKCRKLKEEENILNLVIGESYLGKIDNEYIVLNKKIKIPKKRLNFDFENYKDDFVVVKIKKIIMPNEIIADCDSIQDYVIEEISSSEAEICDINNIDETYIQKIVWIEGIIEKKIQTSGPLLLRVKDKTGSIILKIFSNGNRYTNLKEGDGIRAKIRITLYDNQIEGEILELKKINYDLEKVNQKIIENAKTSREQFSIESEVYKRMLPLFVNAAFEIKKAIYEERPILMRHHADCDGYSGALALEVSIIQMMKEIHRDEKKIWTHYSRIPMKTPFYDYSECTKDIAFFIDESLRFGNKEPLVICIDFGSSIESLLSYKKLKLFDCKIIVIDHHLSCFEEFEKIKANVDILINPHLFNGNEKITAGMLSYELSLFIREHNLKHLPIISGFGDRSDSNEFHQYCKSYSEEDLNFYKKLSEVIDFESYHLRNIEGRGYINGLFTDQKLQKKMVEVIYPHLEEMWREYEVIIEKNKKIVKENPLVVVLENINIINDFPSPGKITGFAKDLLKKELKKDNVVILYVYDEGIVLRSEILDLKLQERIKYLQNKYPEFLIEGGGHSKAGSIRFLKLGKEKILQEVLNWF